MEYLLEKSIHAKMAEENLGIKPYFVLDPTFLLDKQYYLDLIQNYKRDFDFNKKYLMVYQLDKNEIIKKFLNDAVKLLNYTIYEVSQQDEFYVESMKVFHYHDYEKKLYGLDDSIILNTLLTERKKNCCNSTYDVNTGLYMEKVNLLEEK